VQERPITRVGRFDYLSADTEINLVRIIVDEVSFFRRLDILKGDLETRYDYSVYAAFRTIDRYNEGYVSLDNLKYFFRAHHYYYTERELLSIIRRIDTDGDAKISYTEFSDYLKS
jgi:Ca2+-binding EF-hand superfamily protein